MFVYLKTPDVGTHCQNAGGRLVGGEVRVSEGSEGSLSRFHRLYISPAVSPRGRTSRECDLRCTAIS